MVSGVPLNELDNETRERLGLPPNHGDEPVSERVIILGKVLNALKTLKAKDAVWVLKEAQRQVNFQGAESGGETRPSLDNIVRVVAEAFELEPALLKGRRRDRMVTEARQVAMHVLNMTNRFTMAEIGKGLGGRDHSTISYGCQIITQRIQVDEALKEKIKAIRVLVAMV